MAYYNDQDNIRAAIQSILNQTYQDLELICIDDHSTDSSQEIVRELASQDTRIVMLRSLERQGPAGARNLGLACAKGEFIAINDSDDLSTSRRIERQVAFLKSNPMFFLVGSGAIFVRPHDEFLGFFYPLVNPVEIKKRMGHENQFVHSSIMFRNEHRHAYRTCFKYAHDYDFLLGLLAENKLLTNIRLPLVKYQLNPHGISVQKRVDQEVYAHLARRCYISHESPIDILGPSLQTEMESLYLAQGKAIDCAVLISSIPHLENIDVKRLAHGIFKKHGLWTIASLVYPLLLFGARPARFMMTMLIWYRKLHFQWLFGDSSLSIFFST